MELLDECADSEETMAVVADMVYDQIKSESQRYVILVGDSKTYHHLIKVKRLYQCVFKNVLIFPGDWHILKNYQSVIMKVWFQPVLRILLWLVGTEQKH